MVFQFAVLQAFRDACEGFDSGGIIEGQFVLFGLVEPFSGEFKGPSFLSLQTLSEFRYPSRQMLQAQILDCFQLRANTSRLIEFINFDMTFCVVSSTPSDFASNQRFPFCIQLPYTSSHIGILRCSEGRNSVILRNLRFGRTCELHHFSFRNEDTRLGEVQQSHSL